MPCAPIASLLKGTTPLLGTVLLNSASASEPRLQQRQRKLGADGGT